MQRYLIHIGYAGTRLRGVQKQPEDLVHPSSVQGYLDDGLKDLHPANEPLSIFSSRTDAGVHALCNTAHVDLCRRHQDLTFGSEYITAILNKYFFKKNVDIRVHKTVKVPSRFHARFDAIERSYLYRLMVLTSEIIPEEGKKINIPIPIGEFNRAHVIKSPFDSEKFQSGCDILQGSHNYATFMKARSKSDNQVIDPNRSIDFIKITKGRPLLSSAYDPLCEYYEFWDFNISGRSFLYNQVRRIVGTLIALAQGKIDLDNVQWMLDNPAPQNWNPRGVVVPAYGLFLKNVKYPNEAFVETPPMKIL